MILALSSTAIVLQTLRKRDSCKTDGGTERSFSVLLFQDIAVIPMLAVLPLLAIGSVHGGPGEHGDITWVSGLPGWAQTLAVLGAVAAIILVGRFLSRYAFRFIARTRLRETFTAAALLLVIGVAILMSRLGLSPALGTFIAGVVLADSEYRHELESDIDPFKGLLLGVFFIAVGASVDFHLIKAQPGTIAALVGALIAVKFLVLFVLGRVFKMGLDQNLLFAFALAQGGEFAFVLFSFATQNGVVSTDVASPLVAVVALSMAFTPLMLLINEKLLQPRFGTREQEEREADAIEEMAPVIVAGFGNVGSIAARLLFANGVRATVLEYDSDRVELARKLGYKVYYGDACRHDLLAAAGAGEARLIVIAIDSHDRIMELVGTVRKHFPQMRILARAAGRPEAYELINAGLEHVYRETLDTSLRMGVDALRLLGLRSHQAHRAAKMFRRHDEGAMAKLAEMWGDSGGYINVARQHIRDLEEALQREFHATDDTRDMGWDTNSLRGEYGGADQESSE